MSLPKFQINSVFNDKKHIEALLLPLVVITVVIFILILGFVLPKQRQKTEKSEAKKNLERITNTTTIKNAEGKIQEVPPEVLQITPLELKSMIDSKQNILIIQVNNSVDFSRELRIKGSIFIQKKNFDTSTNNLTAETFNVFVSKDGIDSAEAIVKIIQFGLPREKNVNLEGGLNAWKGKGYPVEI